MPRLKHWLLDEARYSFHGGYSTYRRGSNAYPTQLTYPQHPGAHPTAWVAYGKHANYRNQSECDAGNGGGDVVNWVFSFDTCEGNSAFFASTRTETTTSAPMTTVYLTASKQQTRSTFRSILAPHPSASGQRRTSSDGSCTHGVNPQLPTGISFETWASDT